MKQNLEMFAKLLLFKSQIITFAGAWSISLEGDVLSAARKRFYTKKNNWLTVTLKFQETVIAAFLCFRPVAEDEWLCKNFKNK